MPRIARTCAPVHPPLRTEDAFRHSCESNNPPQSRPYVAGISDDIASSLRGIIRSILIREDYRCRIFAPPKARFTSRVDRTTGENVYCLFIAATRVERTTLFLLFFFYSYREIFNFDSPILVFSEEQKWEISIRNFLSAHSFLFRAKKERKLARIICREIIVRPRFKLLRPENFFLRTIMKCIVRVAKDIRDSICTHSRRV